jgi:NitT/TauT family transport system ATP-binding protein
MIDVLPRAPAATQTPAISARGVCMSYTVKGVAVAALHNFCLELRSGEFVTLIGPSGCGKSTFLRIVADLVRPTSGEVEVAGLKPAEARRRRAYSFVFQNPTLFPWLTLENNVQFALSIIGSRPTERRQAAHALIDLVGLRGFEQALPRQLSGGMRQRASIARALTLNPQLLLMDEPFGALDEITRDRLNLELLGILSRSGAAVLFVTHSIDEAVILSDRIVVMSARPGRVLEEIRVDLPRPRERRTRFLAEFVETTIRVRKALHDAGS